MTDTPSPQSVVSDRALEQIAFNLCSLHDFPVDFVKANERFARSVITEYLRAAPAPSSLAGGDVTDDDAPTYMRLAQALSRHPEVMVVERSDPTLELTRDSLEHLLDDVFPLAALSPEAPAREWSTDDMRELVTDEQVRWLVSATDVAHGRARLKDILNALTPRHEAPASEDEARRKLINCIDQWDSEMEYDAEDRACLADDILHAFNGPPVVSPAAADELSSNPCQLEAPAEGAGEWNPTRGQVINAICNSSPFGPDYKHPDLLRMSDAILALRARSSAPEAREGEAFPEIEPLFWAWLKERDLCPDGDVVEWQDIIVALDEHEIEIMAAPSADKLREVLVDLTSWFTKPVQGQSGMVWVIPAGEIGADDALNAALDALKAEGC